MDFKAQSDARVIYGPIFSGGDAAAGPIDCAPAGSTCPRYATAPSAIELFLRQDGVEAEASLYVRMGEIPFTRR